MKNYYRRIDDRTIVVDRTPELPSLPDRPAPPQVETKMRRADVLRHFNWTDAQFGIAQTMGFPQGLTKTALTGSGARQFIEYDLNRINEWWDALRSLAGVK